MISGFVELPHTADWAIRVWAPDLAGIFKEAAIGMNTLAGIRLVEEPRISRTFEGRAADAEALLVDFLSELVFAAEQENLAYDQFNVETEQRTDMYLVRARMEGAQIVEQSKVVKAVTFHNLEIRSLDDGLEVELVFDV